MRSELYQIFNTPDKNEFIRRFKKSLCDFRILHNSFHGLKQVLGVVSKNSGMIEIELRDGSKFSCHSRFEAYNLAVYTFMSRNLGVYSPKELTEIYLLSEQLKSNMDSTFKSVKGPSTHGTLGYVGSGASPFFSPMLLVLYPLIRFLKPRTIVQTGVASGVSSSLMLLALKHNDSGRLVDIDLPNRNRSPRKDSDGNEDSVYTPPGREPGWLIPMEYRKRWDLRLGSSSDILPEIGECDMFFHDSEHTYKNMMFEFEWAYNLLPTQGVIGSDDIGWNRAWIDFHKKHPSLLSIFGILDYGVSLRGSD